MNILALLSVVVCCTAAVPLLSEDGGQKETLERAWANGSSHGDTVARRRNKRYVGEMFVSGVVSFLESYLITMGLDQTGVQRVVDNLFPTADSVTAKLDRIGDGLKKIERKMDDLKYLTMKNGVDSEMAICIKQVKHFGKMLANERHSSNVELYNEILSYGAGGIHKQLSIIDDLISDQFLVKLLKLHTHYSDMKNFVTKKDLRKLMLEDEIPSLFMFQALGYDIEYNATRLNATLFNIPKAAIASKLARIKNEHENKVENQKNAITGLLKDCPRISLPRKKWLECTDDFKFGSICTQVCNSPGYPNKGYEPVQCLWNGKWSNNINGETRLMCTIVYDQSRSKLGYFKTKDIMCKNGNCDKDRDHPWCYAEDGSGWDYCLPTIRPGYLWSDPSRRCKTVCMDFADFVGWCYIDYAYDDWDWCMPEVVSDEPERTFKGEYCTDNCGTCGPTDYKWCRTSNSWDYCASNDKRLSSDLPCITGKVWM